MRHETLPSRSATRSPPVHEGQDHLSGRRGRTKPLVKHPAYKALVLSLLVLHDGYVALYRPALDKHLNRIPGLTERHNGGQDTPFPFRVRGHDLLTNRYFHAGAR
jgi:hypothetical protein